MKKLIALIAIIALVCVAAFADGTATGTALTNNTTTIAETTLTLTVNPVFEVQFTNADLTGTYDGYIFPAASVISSSKVAYDSNIYASVNTNRKDATKVSITGTPFASATVATKVGYTLSAGGTDSVTIDKTATAASDPLQITALNKEANVSLKKSQKLTVTLTAADFAAATAATDYEANLTITIAAIS